MTQELNKKFQEKHTWLNGDLSLSKIRNLKRETLLSCQRLNLEVATAAMACVYFEKLVLSHVRPVLSVALSAYLTHSHSRPVCEQGEPEAVHGGVSLARGQVQ